MAWKFTLSLGLLNIPVVIETAAREDRISFNQIHGVCKSRINQKKHCPKCNKEVAQAELIKGYEISKDKYLFFTEEEFKAIKVESDRVLDIKQTVKASEVDPLLFDASYYIQPDAAGRKGYKLVLQAMIEADLVAIASVTMSSREKTVVIRPFAKGETVCLSMHTIFYAPEVKAIPELGIDSVDFGAKELELAKSVLANFEAPFEHSAFSDTYQMKIHEMIEAKSKGEVFEMPTPKARAETTDLMAALTASLKSKPATPPPAPTAGKKIKLKKSA